jgi:hypothetical protein
MFVWLVADCERKVLLLLVVGLLCEKSTAGWWLISQGAITFFRIT